MTKTERRRALMRNVQGNDGMKNTSYTITDSDSNNFAVAVNSATIQLISQNEILIWNIRGSVQQPGGTVGGKFGITVVQNGRPVSNSCCYKRISSIVAPDLATPASGWQDMAVPVVDDHYHFTSTSNPIFRVGTGDIIDFIQIPYNIGWNV